MQQTRALLIYLLGYEYPGNGDVCRDESASDSQGE